MYMELKFYARTSGTDARENSDVTPYIPKHPLEILEAVRAPSVGTQGGEGTLSARGGKGDLCKY